MTTPDHPRNVPDPGTTGLYSIGAVAKMLAIEPATLRSWEERYGLVVPTRTRGAQRIYSRDQIAQLRFVLDQVEQGASAADAHRLLAQSLGAPPDGDKLGEGDVVIVILLAERDRHAAALCEYFLRTEGYEVCLALEPETAQRLAVERRPSLAIVELMISGGGLGLCERLSRDAPVLAVSTLALRDE